MIFKRESTEQYFPSVLFEKDKMVQKIGSPKILKCDHSRDTFQAVLLVLLTILYNAVVTFESEDEIW